MGFRCSELQIKKEELRIMKEERRVGDEYWVIGVRGKVQDIIRRAYSERCDSLSYPDSGRAFQACQNDLALE